MPAFATHYLFFDELLPELEKRADFEMDKGAGGIGCQGPDIFLFHRLWPPFKIYKSLNGVSGALHRSKSEKLFEAFHDYLSATQNRDIAKSYIYAFILHYALDRVCHPYVYARQDEFTAADAHMHPLTAHNIIEHAVDTYLLYSKRGIYPPSQFDSKATFSDDEKVIDEISKLMNYVIKAVTDREVPCDEVARAVADTANIQDILRDKNGRTRRLANCIEGALSPVTKNFKISASIKPKDLEIAADCANIKNKPWVSPYDEIERNESFEELFRIAEAQALELIDGFEAYCRGEKTAYDVTGNISFLTGLEVND